MQATVVLNSTLEPFTKIIQEYFTARNWASLPAFGCVEKKIDFGDGT